MSKGSVAKPLRSDRALRTRIMGRLPDAWTRTSARLRFLLTKLTLRSSSCGVHELRGL